MVLNFNLRQNRHPMRLLFSCCFLLLAIHMDAQVFMRPFDNAASMGMGSATIAIPDTSAVVLPTMDNLALASDGACLQAPPFLMH